MSIPKATMSGDGRRRMDLRVPHRVGYDEIVAHVCKRAVEIGDDWRDEFPMNPSAVWFLKTVRASLFRFGSEGADYWQDDVPDYEADEIENWVKAAVNGAFPLLASASPS